MTIASGIELPEAEIAGICRRHQVRELSPFGSAARGELRTAASAFSSISCRARGLGCWACPQ
jgi:predicted nucleotidyltransferase